MPMKPPTSVSYFHGKITRDRTEDLLMSQGAIEGMFLLRESVNGNYVVSICHCNKISHYNVELQNDNTYQISTGRRFAGPVELVEHHMKHLDGFLTLARIPLERYPAGCSFCILQGVKASFFEDLVRKKATDLGLKDPKPPSPIENCNDSSSKPVVTESAISGPMREHLKRMVLRELHETQHWFHHFIRRSEADERLRSAGHTEGQFLVRQKRDEYGFVLSISYQEQPKHYKINCHFEKLNIDGGQYFDSLVEMIDHYHFRQDGLLCKLRFGIECPGFVRNKNDFIPLSGDSHFEGSHSRMCQLMHQPRRNWHIDGCRRHSSDPMSHNASNCGCNCEVSCSRDTSHDSDTRQQPQPHPQPPSGKPTNSNCNCTDTTSLSTNDLINFSEWSTNLPKLLTDSSVVSFSLNNLEKDPFMSLTGNQSAFNIHTPIAPVKPPRRDIPLPIGSPVSIFTTDSPELHRANGLNEPQIVDQEWLEPDMAFSPLSKDCKPLPQLSIKSSNLSSTSINTANNSITQKLQTSDLNLLDPLFAMETQKVYDSLPINDFALNLSSDRLEVRQKLGGGNFGCVYGGYYSTSNGSVIPVAIKMLKDEVHSQLAAHEILLEAKTMAQLKHQNIVRLIGVCKSDQLLLVLELAPLGPINKYLRRHQTIPVTLLMELSGQIARGMAYLEACKFVHRDLAARNVLLVNEAYAKISDFGMSKALNVGHEYYRAASAGRWPLKWYAPECIYYFRFNSKSDVWSYGVTLWEIFSYGDRPYKGLKGTDILAMIDRGQRLRRPMQCPQPIYELILQCWDLDEVRRPTFAELVLIVSRLCIHTPHDLVPLPKLPTTTNSSAVSIVPSPPPPPIPLTCHYQAPTTTSSSGSSVAKTCYGSGESSQLSSPPISAKPIEKWIRNFISSSTRTESANW